MNKIIFLMTIFSSFTSIAALPCGTIPTEARSDLYWIGVESRSHMDLQLLVYLNPDYKSHYSKVKVVGGYAPRSYTEKDLPTCESLEVRDLRWHSEFVATDHTSGGSSSFSTAYRICFYDSQGQLIASPVVCNSEVGD